MTAGFKFVIFLVLLCMFSFYSAERPNSIKGNYIFEINYGLIFEKESVSEYGFDLECFLDESNHSYSIGFATEFEKNNYYIAPLFSFYEDHFKYFFSIGALVESHTTSYAKLKFGIGYEVFMQDQWIFIPSFNVDYFKSHIIPVSVVALAHEF